MDRTEALARWKRIADGDLRLEPDDYDRYDLHAWVEGIAAVLPEADKLAKSPQQRVNDLTKVIGLSGKVNQHAELERLLKIRADFDPMPVWANPGERDEAIVKAARSISPRLKNVDHDSVLRRAKRLLNKPTSR